MLILKKNMFILKKICLYWKKYVYIEKICLYWKKYVFIEKNMFFIKKNMFFIKKNMFFIKKICFYWKNSYVFIEQLFLIIFTQNYFKYFKVNFKFFVENSLHTDIVLLHVLVHKASNSSPNLFIKLTSTPLVQKITNGHFEVKIFPSPVEIKHLCNEMEAPWTFFELLECATPSCALCFAHARQRKGKNWHNHWVNHTKFSRPKTCVQRDEKKTRISVINWHLHLPVFICATSCHFPYNSSECSCIAAFEDNNMKIDKQLRSLLQNCRLQHFFLFLPP